MRALPLVVVISLLANVALGVAVYSRWHNNPAAAPESDRDGAAANVNAPERGREAVTAIALAGSASRADGAASAATTLKLAGLDDATYVARLRELGFPEGLIRQLVDQRVRARYADRLRAARGSRAREFWRVGPYDEVLSREERAAVRAINREISEEIARLMGGTENELSIFTQVGRSHLAFLSSEKIDQIDAINRDYNELIREVRERTRGGLVLRADREELRLLEREQRADLVATLTPDELREYDLRASPTANSMRNRLTFFEPSEAEFRSLVELRLELDQRFPPSNLTAQEQEARHLAERDLEEKIKATFTPERYAEYKATIDGSFRDTLTIAQKAGLDRAAAVEIMTLKQEVTPRADAIRRQRDLPPVERDARLAAIEGEVIASLTAKLGEHVLADYRKSSGGGWVNRLRPPANQNIPTPIR